MLKLISRYNQTSFQLQFFVDLEPVYIIAEKRKK